MTTAPWPEPRANPDLLGHAPAEQALLAAWRGGRLPHAWLITGPRGIGKATLAFRFCRFLLAHGTSGAPAPSLFGEAPLPNSLFVEPAAPVFQRIAAGGHLDLVTVERRWDEKAGRRRSEIVVDDVRAVQGLVAHTAAEGGWRVVVVDAADEMNSNAANALLKVLEEPPAQTVLLLVAHNFGRLLPTIRSRCRRLPLRPLADDTVAELLGRFAPDLTPAGAAALARLSAGSIGRALTLAGQGGGGLRDELLSLIADLPRLDVAAVLAFGERIGKPDASDTFPVAMEMLRGLLACVVRAAATGAAEPRISDSGPATAGDARAAAVVGRLAGAGGLDRWLEVWDKTGALLARVDSASLDRKQVILTLFTHLQNAVRA